MTTLCQSMYSANRVTWILHQKNPVHIWVTTRIAYFRSDYSHGCDGDKLSCGDVDAPELSAGFGPSGLKYSCFSKALTKQHSYDDLQDLNDLDKLWIVQLFQPHPCLESWWMVYMILDWVFHSVNRDYDPKSATPFVVDGLEKQQDQGATWK